MARLAGKEKVYIPAASVVTVRAQGHVKGAKQGEQMLVECVNTSLPDGLIVLPMLVDPHRHGFSIQVAHLSQEDMWLHPRTRLGVLSVVEYQNSERPVKLSFSVFCEY